MEGQPHGVQLVCVICGRIRHSQGVWGVPDDQDAEILVESDVSHRLCPACRGEHYEIRDDL